MADNQQPIYILAEGSNRTIGKDAQRNNIMAAKLVAETVRTTLGPKGMDKMIVNSMNDVTITNDGVTILEEMQIEHPAAKMIVEVAKTQENECGDGTTTAVVLAGELLKNAEGLLDKNIHPTVIARGYRIAADKTIEVLNSISEKVSPSDDEILIKIAQTAMTGKGAESSKENLSILAVKAVKQVIEGRDVDLDNIKIEKKIGGSIEESELVKGIVLDKERVESTMPRIVKDAKIALLNSALEIKNTEIDAKIQINDPSQIQSFLDQEEAMLKNMVNSVINSGANAVFCTKGIDDVAQHFLSKAGIYAVRRIRESDIQKLAKATGGKIVSNLKELRSEDLGHAGLIEEKKVDDEYMTFVVDCDNPKAITLLIRGSTEHVLAEVERAVKDALGDIAVSLKVGKVVAGAGAPEVEVSKELRSFANSLSGREQLAVLAYADAMEVIPRTLSENAGLDPVDMLTELKSRHDNNEKWAGLDVFKGKVVDAWSMGIIEPLKVKTQAVRSATEVSEMILRIDDVIAGGKEKMPSMPGGMPQGYPDM